jgi:acyl-CoA oxidase
MKNFELIGGFGLTEKEIGSDASSLTTSVRPVEGGYILNGNKMWIGNGNQDLIVVWARNESNNNVEGFIVENRWKGVRPEVIRRKLALRIVQNCHIIYDNVFVPEENKLPKAKNFVQGANKILFHSRVMIPYMCAGIGLGVYERVIKYITEERQQFGTPLASFQLQ